MADDIDPENEEETASEAETELAVEEQSVAAIEGEEVQTLLECEEESVAAEELQEHEEQQVPEGEQILEEQQVPEEQQTPEDQSTEAVAVDESVLEEQSGEESVAEDATKPQSSEEITKNAPTEHTAAGESKPDEEPPERKIEVDKEARVVVDAPDKEEAISDSVKPKLTASKSQELRRKSKLDSRGSLGRKKSVLTAARDKRDSEEFLIDNELRKIRSERMAAKAKPAIGTIISIHRLSGIDFGDRKVARYMNSYKLDSDNPFNPEKVQKILENVMTEALENLTYDVDKCPKQAKWASSAIRGKVKELQFERYKIICFVSIGEKNSQDILVACRFLWDSERDRFAYYATENTFVYGIALCFGLYYE